MNGARHRTPRTLPEGMLFWERGWMSSNSVLCLGEHNVGAGLIDSGHCLHAPQLLGLLRAALGKDTLRTLINTHLHSDHCGGNAAVQAVHDSPSLRTFVPMPALERVRVWDETQMSHHDTGQRCPRFGADVGMSPGEVISSGRFAWEVHAAPGHDPDAVLLFERRHRVLVTADALWGNGFGVVFPELTGEPGFAAVRRTLDSIADLAPDIVIPGHGPIIHDVDAALDRAGGRLSRMTADPKRHAWHGVKVLLKYHLLEVGREPMTTLLAWCQDTPLIQALRRRWAPDEDLRTWLDRALDELEASDAIVRTQDEVLNC